MNYNKKKEKKDIPFVELYKPFPSKSPNKKYSVYVKNKEGVPKLISFGQKNSIDFISGTATKEQREAYRARASKVKKKDGTLAIKDKNSRAYWSFNHSWG